MNAFKLHSDSKHYFSYQIHNKTQISQLKCKHYDKKINLKQVTYSTLKDPANEADQEGEEVAEGAYNFADLLRLQKGDLIKAERLARESLCIREALHIDMEPSDPHHFNFGRSKDLLARILKDQGN
jgi:hypothetical protein